jgi:hypothetical protein
MQRNGLMRASCPAFYARIALDAGVFFILKKQRIAASYAEETRRMWRLHIFWTDRPLSTY